MFEWRIYCECCKSLISQGGLDDPVKMKASEVLEKAKHNPDCDLNHNMRSVPRVTGKTEVVEQTVVTTYRIYPGIWKDAEFDVL